MTSVVHYGGTTYTHGWGFSVSFSGILVFFLGLCIMVAQLVPLVWYPWFVFEFAIVRTVPLLLAQPVAFDCLVISLGLVLGCKG